MIFRCFRMENSQNKLPKSEINNEDVINELTKDLQSSLLTKDNKNDSPTSSTSNTSDNFVINPDDRGESDNETPHPDFQFKTKLPSYNSSNADDLDKDEDDKSNHESDEEDYDVTLKDLELTLTESEKEDRKSKADMYKNDGNEKFKIGEFEESIDFYTKGLKICPLSYKKDRAILYSNRAASKMKLNKNKEAIKDCSKAIENDDSYIKAYYRFKYIYYFIFNLHFIIPFIYTHFLFRRAQCNEQTDLLDESLADYNKILEFDPNHAEARKAIARLPPLIEERNERMKTEMMSKLKDLGNLVLKPFGLSTENFKMTQDPETKGYSINFQPNK